MSRYLSNGRLTYLEQLRAMTPEIHEQMINLHVLDNVPIYKIAEIFEVSHVALCSFLGELIAKREVYAKDQWYLTEEEQIKGRSNAPKIPYYFKFENEKTIGDIKKMLPLKNNNNLQHEKEL